MKGAEMMMNALKAFIPQEVWDAIERGVPAVISKVDALAERIEKIERTQTQILILLQALRLERIEGTEGIHDTTTEPHATNGLGILGGSTESCDP